MDLYLGHLSDTQEECLLPLSEVGGILIAGHCGYGKSVYIHALLKRLFAEYGPESLGVLLFDGKRVEFHRLKSDPHLLLPVGQSLKDFKSQLAFLEGLIGKRKESDPPILFIVDEFAEVCFNHSGIKRRVERLIDVGPANGIYLVLATQVESRYSKKMLNLAGTRISFNQYEVDSMRFIGTKEADGLSQGEAIVVTKGKQATKVRIELADKYKR